MKIEEIRELIQMMKENQISEIDLESEGEKVRIRSEGQPVPALAPQHAGAPMHIYTGGHPGMPMAPMHAPHAALPDPSQTAGGAAGTAPAPPAEEDPGIVITSPIVGIFYSSPSPDKPAFVEPGAEIDENTVLCIIEAMKVMNEIKAETTGKVREVMVTNGQSVEYGQPLFVIDPV